MGNFVRPDVNTATIRREYFAYLRHPHGMRSGSFQANSSASPSLIRTGEAEAKSGRTIDSTAPLTLCTDFFEGGYRAENGKATSHSVSTLLPETFAPRP